MSSGVKSPKNRGLWPLIMPSFLVLAAITVVPIIVTFIISLFYFSLSTGNPPAFVGSENYVELLGDARFHNAVEVTLKLIFIPVFLQVLIGLFLAMILKEKLRGLGWVRITFLLPAVIPPAVSGLVWKLFIVPDAGGLTYAASRIGVDLSLDLLSAPSSALWVIIATSVWVGTPFVTLLLLSALETLGEEQYEAARIDGASWFQRHWHISLPEIWPIIITVTVFRVLEALAIFPVIYILTGGGPAGSTEPVNYYAYINGFEYLRIDYAATIIFFFFLGLMTLTAPFLVNIARRESREAQR